MEKLIKWLAKVEARQLWTQRIPHVGRIRCYQIGKGIAIVNVYTRNRGEVKGWDLFVPASLENRIDLTLEAAELALGIEKPVHAREILSVLSLIPTSDLGALSVYVKAKIAGTDSGELEGATGAELEELVGEMDSSDLVSFGKIVEFEIAKRDRLSRP